MTPEQIKQFIQGEWASIAPELRPSSIKNADGSIGTAIVGFVPNVDQSFAGLFKKSSPPPGRTQPPCVKKSTPWQGKIKVVKNGVITPAVIK